MVCKTKIKVLNESDSSPPQSIKLSPEKIRESRKAVREAIRVGRKKVKELRQGIKEGHNLSDDVDTWLGEIELLQKELQSIDEGGHTTFLMAKDLISPKKDISAKKSKLREEVSRLEKEIKHFEARLTMPNLTDEERSNITLSISGKNDVLKGLEEEAEALRNFDHTRFVQAREESKSSSEFAEAHEKLESRMEELNAQMFEALEEVNESMIETLMAELNSLKEEKRKLMEPDGDPLLQE